MNRGRSLYCSHISIISRLHDACNSITGLMCPSKNGSIPAVWHALLSVELTPRPLSKAPSEEVLGEWIPKVSIFSIIGIGSTSRAQHLWKVLGYLMLLYFGCIYVTIAQNDILQPVCVLTRTHTKMFINVFIKRILNLEHLHEHHEQEVQNWPRIEVIRPVVGSAGMFMQL